MPRYKFEIKVKESYTAFDYTEQSVVTVRNKSVVAPTYQDARDKIEAYMHENNVYTYTAKLIKASKKSEVTDHGL